MNVNDLKEMLEILEERPNLDYKKSSAWSVENIAKDILAMSNIRDGGTIIIGVDQTTPGSFNPSGMLKEHSDTYDIDIIKDQVGEFADPNVDFSIDILTFDAKEFIGFTVREFKEIPAICKRDGTNLRKGAIYIRSKSRRAESSEIKTSSEMRELLELAVDKGMKRLRKRGYVMGEFETSVSELFDKELGDL